MRLSPWQATKALAGPEPSWEGEEGRESAGLGAQQRSWLEQLRTKAGHSSFEPQSLALAFREQLQEMTEIPDLEGRDL
jgi:hypothetical protein